MAVDNVPPNLSTPAPPTPMAIDNVPPNPCTRPRSENFTLYLTVGDDAKDFALSVFVCQNQNGRFYFLQDNSLNVREATPQQLQENTDIRNIKDILGLQYGKIYENVEELRYGHLMIMANKGHDASPIIGILISFLHYFWPSLIKVKSFMQMFIIPPIVKAYPKETNAVNLPSYTIPECYGNKLIEYNLVYCKGAPESQGNADVDQHTKDFCWFDYHDDDAIEFAFSEKKIEARYQWLQFQRHQACTYFDSKDKRIRYLDFIKNVVAADLQRSIPSMVDGLKPDQREILFYAFKKPIIHEIEVAQFSAYVSDVSPYHHGEASLVRTIIGMAQNYGGSNNINLLQLNGRLGTSLMMGGKDHDASGRYIFTQLSPITRYLFDKDKDDEPIPHYLNDDGQSIEHAWFIPIIPMVLVNGGEEGTECSLFIPNYNPRDIIANLKRLLEGKAVVPMIPWYKGLNKGAYDSTTISTANMHLFGSKGELKKYDTPEQILEDFYQLRLKLYEQMRGALVSELKIASSLLENKVKFISEVCAGDISLFPSKEKDKWCAELNRRGFKSLSSIEQAVDNVKETEEEPGTGYDYLLYIPTLSYTSEKIEELKQASDAMKKDLDEITKSKPESLWLRDLDALDHQLIEEEYTLDERIAKIDFQSSQDVDESSPEIAEEASMNKIDFQSFTGCR